MISDTLSRRQQNLNISGSEGMSVGLLILICVVFRFLFYVGIAWRK